ncbi:MAG: hypothetical protein ABIR16_05795 [Dokdonella sp.]
MVDDSASVDSTTAVDNTATDTNADQKPNASIQTAAANEPRPLTLLDRYVQSTDLFELVVQLRADADAGDANAARIIAMAYDECYPFAAENQKVVENGRLHLDQFTESERTIYLSFRRRSEQRCVGFIATGGIKPADVRSTGAKASALNDLTSQARQLAEKIEARRSDEDAPNDWSAAEIELSKSIALSGDPEAIAMLAHGQDDRHLGRNVRGMFWAGDPTNLTAWMLVACDLGRDCGANGYIMRQQCLFVGLCFNGDYREYLRRRRLSPDKYDLVLARERKILQAIKNGDVSHLFP